MLNLSVFHGIGFGFARCTLKFAIPLDVICRAIPLLQTFAAGLAGRTHSDSFCASKCIYVRSMLAIWKDYVSIGSSTVGRFACTSIRITLAFLL